MTYADFLLTKRPVAGQFGPTIETGDIHPLLFDFQRDLVRWAVRKGRAALFAGIGTTGYVSVQNDRRFVGCELKRSYFDAACRNIDRASGVLDLGLLETVPA